MTVGCKKLRSGWQEELAEVCRDYYKEVWAEALNRARVLAASEWRSVENIFYP